MAIIRGFQPFDEGSILSTRSNLYFFSNLNLAFIKKIKKRTICPLFLLVKGETYQHIRGDNRTNIYIDICILKKFQIS